MAKLSDLTDEQWFTRLERRRMEQRDTIRTWWQYYDSEQPLYYVAKILEEQQDRFPALTINWCEKFVDMIDRRVVVESFRQRGEDKADDALWEIWQRNDLDEAQSENNIASLVTGVSYMMVGPSDEGALITVETPESVAVEIDSRTGRVIAALKVWKSDPQQALEDMAELWLPANDGEPARVVSYENQREVDQKQLRWMAQPARLQSSPEVPVVPFMNRKRCHQGRSELRALKPVVDAANQVATNMMAAVEHHAVPRKWALNMDPKQFTDKDGNPVPAYKIATGAVWINPFDENNPDAPEPKVGQFAASDLRNFHDTLGVLARVGAGLCDLPPHTFGFGVSDNPPSADSIRASQDDWVSRIEGIQTARGNCYERVMRLAAAVEDDDPTKMVRLETRFRNAATPTRDAAAKAAVETYQSGITDLRQAREDYGLSDTQIRAIEAREADAANAETQRLMRVVPDAGAGA